MADPVLTGELLNDFMESVQDRARKAKEPTQEEKLRDAVTALLHALGEMRVQEDALTFEGDKFIFPGSYEGKIPAVIDFLRNYMKQEEMRFDFNKTLPYRPYDGAYAFMTVMRQLTGTTGFGVNRMTFFGPEPPEFISIPINAKGDTAQIPWGLVEFPAYGAKFDVGAVRTDSGYTFHLTVNAPRKHRKEIEAIFSLIEKHLKDNSIYRGQAINGHDMQPEFIDLSRVDPEKVVYSQSVMDDLLTHVWAPIRFTERYRNQGMPLKRAVLFAGPFGTGKTLGCLLTAKEAVEQGWTFIMCRTGQDKPADVIKTAELYAPAVVVIEDLDVHAGSSTKVEISQLLEMLDGAVNKGNEIIGLFTTNHIEDIQKGALRPGRIDAVIEITDLDEPAFRRLIINNIGADWLADDVDYTAVAEAMHGFLPAFVAQAAQRSLGYIMARNNGQPGVVDTEALVGAARTLRPQLELMDGAKEGVRPNLLEDAIRDVVDGSLKRTRLNTHDDYRLQVEPPTVLNGGKS
jgi:DNA polymerase III delta prime subunit